MAHDEPREIAVSRKHFTLRVVLVIALFIGGLTAIGFGIAQMFRADPGVYTITASPDKENPFNYLGVQGSFYIDGDSGQVKAKKNAMTNLLNESLRAASYRFDEKKTYEAYSSIARVNQGLGTDVKVDERVYLTLQDAYKRSLEDNNFSLFAAPLFEAWSDILNGSPTAYAENDPLNNATADAYIKKAAAIVNDPTNYSLTFKGEGVVNLSISEAYKAFRSEYELDSTPVISLNSLHDAYVLNEVAMIFNREGYKNGVLFTQKGFFKSLANEQETTAKAIDYKEKKAFAFGAFDIKGDYTLLGERHFTFTEDPNVSNPSYELLKDGVTYHRHLGLNIKTGLPHNLFSSTFLIYEGDLLDGATSLVSFNGAETIEEAKALAKPGAMLVTFASKTAYQSEQAKSKFQFASGSEYEAISL